ncbi:MAG: IS3 family transposase [Elusimicrobia bacterium]|nr:IS3 family transposase [Elusimicrobiota bacterium]
MAKKRYTEEQIVAILKESAAGAKTEEICRKYGVSHGTFYLWRTKFAGMAVPDIKRLRALEDENLKLKRKVGELTMDLDATKELLFKKLVRPKARRAAAQHVVEVLGLPQRRACRLTSLCRATWQYEPKPESPEDLALKTRIRELAAQRRRFGSPRIWRLLDREGWGANHKRVERIYAEERLSLRLKRRRKQAAAVRVPLPVPTGPNQVWSMDFVFDWLVRGRRIKMLTIVDDFTRECLAIETAFGLGGARVVQVLSRLFETRGPVVGIRSDNGPEFAGNALDSWAYSNGVRLDFIRPGKPTENAYIESFNGRLRDDCLNDHQFLTMPEAQVIIEAWRKDYNEARPHGSLDGLTPGEFAERHTTMLNKLALKEHRFILA